MGQGGTGQLNFPAEVRQTKKMAKIYFWSIFFLALLTLVSLAIFFKFFFTWACPPWDQRNFTATCRGRTGPSEIFVNLGCVIAAWEQVSAKSAPKDGGVLP